MGRLTCILRGKAASGAILALVILLQWGSPARAAIQDRFAGYTPDVREQAGRVVAAATPGNDASLGKEVRALRKLMYARGVLSLNAVPDLVFERALREGWRNQVASPLRIVIAVSPLSASAWALLIKDDVLAARMDELPRDLEGFGGAMHEFTPAAFGYGAWLASFLSAAACWFVVWGAIALFLRARPALEADLARIVVVPPRDFVAAILVAVLFLLPVVSGLGLAVAACFWMVLSAGYLRRGEFAIVGAVVALLAALLVGGGLVHSLNGMAGDVRGGGWLAGEGYYPRTWPGETSGRRWSVAGPSSSWLVKYARARAAMNAGDPAESERLWTELIRAGKGMPEVYNNRGVSLAMQGKNVAGLSDFETTLARRPRDGPALWNAYQIYLQSFNLERARAVQPLAWDSLAKMSPYYFRPADMEAGEWVASALPGEELVRLFRAEDGGPALDVGRSDFFVMFFRPLKPSGALAFLVMVFLAVGIWKLLAMRIWVHSACRGCGALTMIAGPSDPLDLCNLCRARVGSGLKGGAERDRRAQGIAMHRRYVRACSVLVPGSGALWAGKGLRALLYGAVLALSLAGVTASAGTGEGGAIISELRHGVAFWAAVAAVVVWFGGVVWGLQSFHRLQENCSVSGVRR